MTKPHVDHSFSKLESFVNPLEESFRTNDLQRVAVDVSRAVSSFIERLIVANERDSLNLSECQKEILLQKGAFICSPSEGSLFELIKPVDFEDFYDVVYSSGNNVFFSSFFPENQSQQDALALLFNSAGRHTSA